MEQSGDVKVTKEDLRDLVAQYLELYQYDRAVKFASLNYTTGVAHGRVKYGFEGGLDAWRKLYHRYVPLADDLQNIPIRELIVLKPVAETDVDNLFSEVERITELYIKVGESDLLQEKWVKAAILQNLPDKLVITLSMQLRQAKTIEEMQSIVNIYVHDHKTGMIRGQTGPMICLAENETAPTYAAVAANVYTKQDTQETEKQKEDVEQGSLDVVKGSKKDKGKGKGYGQCWHCGQHGHPRRECPEWLKLQGGSVAALKGAGWYNGKGKGKKGKGKKDTKGKGWNNYGKSVGKSAGKSLNYWGRR